ncbi:putative integral membrane protein [Mycobacterium kansasii]|uniref:Putative integral membrane protein n=1 Tax=Mycobacterium kansasii TaxID=1768 RepID=A0A1V3WFF4_MYCKA|nr:putative integral membrane protein [Mycobacterium kansasii]
METAGCLRGRRIHGLSAVVDQQQSHRGTPLAFRPVRQAHHAARPVPRRPTLDRHARGGAHRLGPWLPARWRHWWWALLLAFVPIHLVISAIVPARSLLGLAVGWFVGALVVLVVGTPALEVPLDGAVRALAKRGFVVAMLTVVRPGGPGRWCCRPPRRTPSPGQQWSSTVRINAAAARCGNCGGSCGCAAPKPRRYSLRCAVPSSIAH